MKESDGGPDLRGLPGIPRDQQGPVFRAQWEAQAFAMAVKLHEGGHFTWHDWAGYLAEEIANARERGDKDDGSNYYRYWLAALEKIAAAKGLLTTHELVTRKDQWERSARETPHGQPIQLHRTS